MENKYCPICGEENMCMAGTSESEHCWCNMEQFPKEIFKLVPVESIRKHCICKKCLNTFKEGQKIVK
ncbi:cysteine-rich CWC family protein [Neobacillus massiliamazoniensis]|uniref:Cysteine-rich CWC family protein n=1 Tax=Neobacillus massiliamazoniensis TaxID=1499688 RepID=A0A0U1P4A2_9BACI|nr:cysteine-rich CWC family protein [Neobacillus massiliamazoniensis]CRK85070.1 hypothetical protein BN000_05129 [Neobacillus massiliamazoniensis]